MDNKDDVKVIQQIVKDVERESVLLQMINEDMQIAEYESNFDVEPID